MATIRRSDVIAKGVNDLNIQLSTDKIPNQTEDKVRLTYSLNKQYSTFLTGNGSTSTGSNSTTFPTPSAGGEIYLTGVQVSLIKDATCDQATGTMSISVIPEESGIATTLLQVPIITLTAQSHDLLLSLPYPLKLKVGSQGGFTASYTVGTMSRTVRYFGYMTSSG